MKDPGLSNVFADVIRYGGLGAMFTLSEHRRKGYGRLCAAAASRRLLSLGINPYAYIELGNAASIRLFREMGYERTEESDWITFQPHM